MSSALAIGVSAIAANAYGGAAVSAAGLQAQLQRYQKQLSDCVNCASAKTPEGKANIQALSARISQIEQRIVQKDNARSNPVDEIRPASAAPAIGSLINVFA